MSQSNRFHADHRHSEHPDLRGRKELLGSILVARHLALGRKVKGLKGAGAAVLVRVRERSDIDDEPMGDFLGALASSLRTYATDKKLPGDHLAIARFNESVGRLGCAGCASPCKCSGNMISDPRAVAAGGLCMTPLSDNFDRLALLASAIYDKVLPTGEQLSLRMHSSLSADPGVGARTVFPDGDDAGSRRAVVEVSLPLRRMDPDHVAGLPYILLHELFVHGPEAWSTPGRREATPETCAFREGFVDAAVAFLLRTQLNIGAISLFEDVELSAVIAFATITGHQIRATLGSGGHADVPSNAVPSLRQDGAMLFQRFEDLGFGRHAVLLAATMNTWSDAFEARGSYLEALGLLADDLPLDEDTPRESRQLLMMLAAAWEEGGKVDVAAVRQWLLHLASLDNPDF